jgi:hypothetical protein
MTYDPAQGGRQPRIVPIKTWDLLALPIIGPLICRLLGGGIGPRKDSQKAKAQGGKYGN